MKDQRNLVRELEGNVCRCGKTKNRAQTFCRSCYYQLPEPMRAALYNRIGAGYEEAYQAAVAFLDEELPEVRS